jgi:uncharacterized protein (TIGR02996 family)
MDDRLRTLLSAVLSGADDLAPRLVLADWLDDRSDPRARKVRQHCETGHIHFDRVYSLSGDGAGGTPSVTFLVIQMLPQPVAVEFGCRCAEHVFPLIRRRWPDERRPEQLVGTIRGWLRGEETKLAVRRAVELMVDRTDFDGLPAETHDWPPDQQRALYRSMCSARTAMYVALAVGPPASSDRWVREVCSGALEALTAADSRRRERTWQRREMQRLLSGH